MTGVPPKPKKSLIALIADIPGLITDLIRDEIEHLKKELISKVTQAGIGVGLILAAVTILLFATGTFTAAGVLGLATVLPAWAAALIVGGVLLLIAGILVGVGISQIKRGASAPQESIDSIKKDVRVIRGIGEQD